MNTADRIIYACLLALFLMGVLSFFQSPAYEKGAWVVLGAVSSAMSGALGFKFGVTTEKGLKHDADVTVALEPESGTVA